MEKYAGSGVSVHAPSTSNKENRRTEGLNRYLQALQSNQSASPGQARSYIKDVSFVHIQWKANMLQHSVQIKLHHIHASHIQPLIRMIYLLALMVAVPAADQQGSVEAEKVLSASPMMQVEGFFMALTSSNTDGRVVVHKQGMLNKAL